MRDSGHPQRAIQGMFASRRHRLAIAAVSGALCLLSTACQGTSTAGSLPAQSSSPSASSKPAAHLTISPANGSKNVGPNAGVKVTAANGKVQKVTVTRAGGVLVAGAFSAGNTVWHTNWALRPSTRYTVTATGVNAAGQTTTATSTFTTLTPAATFSAEIFEGYQQTYGVGMPILINFSQPVTRKAAVERSLEVTTSKPVVGSWFWDGNQTLYFRPRTYWPSGTQVTFNGHFNGVEAAPGVYGTANLTQTFTIGASLIVVASTRTHYMHLYYNGKPYGTWPISTGQPGDDTANGTYLTIEKGNPTRMVGNGYNVLVPYAVRFTWSGNYIHDAYWSVLQQGHVNVSHGCVNVSPAHSEIYYKLAVPGDPVTITGSPVAGKWDDGWTVWFMTWKQLLRGSALHEAVMAGPSGSSFVDPSTVPPATYSFPLDSSTAGNYLAG